MVSKKTIFNLIVLLSVQLLFAFKLSAATESYVQFLSGKIKKGDSSIVTDDKFRSLSIDDWNKIRNTNTENIITFELRQDTSFYYQNKSFSCTINFSIFYYTSRDQEKPQEIKNISLTINYDTAVGKPLKLTDLYKFKNAYKVIVVVNSINSKEWGDKLPAIFRLKNQILIERSYPMDANISYNKLPDNEYESVFTGVHGPSTSNDVMFRNYKSMIYNYGITSINGQVVIAWSGSSPKFDLEWTFIDKLSYEGMYIDANTIGSLTWNDLEKWMTNNSSRVTVSNTTFTLNAIYPAGYILVRIRSVDDGVIPRNESPWQYNIGNQINCLPISGHEQYLNWQYNASFAEESKMKEVISYFDASLRSRQMVTLSNTTQNAIIAETIYDKMGRAAANILPAPTNDNTLHYFKLYNQNLNGVEYSYDDLNTTVCNTSSPTLLSNSTGASKYYSSNSGFINTINGNFIPNANGLPLAVTQYTPDNTGRIKKQGGVGQNFQIGSTKETSYFYGKPLQTELDRLFGVEVGNASHYSKNMVIDPNGQVSVSYIDANGKTIATALAGNPPQNLNSLSSSSGAVASTSINQELIKSSDFQKNSLALTLSSTATFLATSSGNYTVHYSIDPSSLVTSNNGVTFCNTCYYDIEIKVQDACTTYAQQTSQAFSISPGSCTTNAVTGNVLFNLTNPGEYYITYLLKLSKQNIAAQEDYYITHNPAIRTFSSFINDELNNLNLAGCYSECSTCKEKLGSEQDFTKSVNDLIDKLNTESFNNQINKNDAAVTGWIHNKYVELYNNCATISATCTPKLSACDSKLQQLKADVIPGGQYALYTYTETLDANGVDYIRTYTYTERNINVLRFYNDPNFTDITYTDENGNIIHIKDLLESDFIAQYILHPEWADYFVLKHVEYCSYQWCTAHSEVYNFQQTVEQSVSNYQDAVSKNFFDDTHSTIYKLLSADPFFATGGLGANYYSAMQSDLQNCSSVSGIALRDPSTGNALSSKNIVDFIDWTLYCMPSDASATAGDFANSWTNCSISTNCRSLSQEWELYRNYYFQLRGKYIAIVKAQTNPDCVNCFIGNDAFSKDSSSTVTIANCISANAGSGNTSGNACPLYSDFHVERVVVNFYDNVYGTYEEYYDEEQVYIVYNNGPVTSNVVLPIIQEHWDYYYGQYYGYGSGYYYNSTTTAQINAGQDRVYIGNNVTQWHLSYGYYEGNSYSDTRTLNNTSIICPNGYLPAPPSTSCKNNALAPYYTNKIRVFNEYSNVQTAMNCMVNNLPGNNSTTTAAQLQAYKDKEAANVDALKIAWTNTLRGVVETENQADIDNGQTPRFAALVDVPQTVYNTVKQVYEQVNVACPTIQNIVDNLAVVAKYNITNATSIDNIRATSTLPINVYATNPNNTALSFNSFADVFNTFVPSYRALGFNENLIETPYPYTDNSGNYKQILPIKSGANVSKLNGTNICSNISALQNRYNASGSSKTFYNYLKDELGDDFVLTESQFNNLLNKCSNSCGLLDEPLNLPAAFLVSASTASAWINCSDVNNAKAGFDNTYAGLVSSLSTYPYCTQLYRTTLTNYLNHYFGFAVSYADYFPNAPYNSCPVNGVVYNKAVTPVIKEDYFACARATLSTAFMNAGLSYEKYILEERQKFSNAYISKCLNASASANLEGTVYEYHYTLYYYDQAGNLVKTIPPEGVQLLTADQLQKVADFRKAQSGDCTGATSGASENKTDVFTALSNNLQSQAGKGFEMWLYNTNGLTSQKVRFITTDNKYFIQAAITDYKLWLELYTMTPDGNGSIELNLSGHAYADIAASKPLQNWVHLFINANTYLNSDNNDLTLYIDGKKLTTVTTGTPPYPFDWEITAGNNAGSLLLPAEDIATLKHLRLYNRQATDAEVYANYLNSCLNPVGNLANSGPLTVWGRFNKPTAGSATTIAANSQDEFVDRFIVPDHTLPTWYAYNSLNQVVEQNTPDAGKSQFWYDKLGRLAISQNAEQNTASRSDNTINPSNRYSYTRYDAFGRIIEVGEKLGVTINPSETDTRSDSWLTSWLASGSNRQVTVTAYDEQPSWVPSTIQGQQLNLQKRVVATALLSSGSNPAQNRLSASYYTYDIAGNVNKLWQENTALATAEQQYVTGSNGLKEIKYEYDLISGKVNKVLYQDGRWDQFYYSYQYDADNRVTDVYSSRVNYDKHENTNWHLDAHYTYYPHGPLARTELGNQFTGKVQGLDYAYTLQGWLKGMNGQFLDASKDMAGDGYANSPFNTIARDAVAYTLQYYNGDYTPIGANNSSIPQSFAKQYSAPAITESGTDLFNGNISGSTYAIQNIENNASAGYTYRYDQLNRLVAMNRHAALDNNTNAWGNGSIIQNYKEQISYDANGNIKTYLRNNGSGSAMDNLTYGYTVDNNGRLVNNKLRHVKDAVGATTGLGDIGNQNDDNYQYDNIGNLIKDNAEGISNINWTVYGKIADITKSSTAISYVYDAGGNRIQKTVNNGSNNTSTYYVRDAQGNTLAVYENNNSSFNWKEQTLYGSSRLGMLTPNVSITTALGSADYNGTNDQTENAGNRIFEITNHLGNVLATITDKKIAHSSNGTTIDYYTADLVTA
ncbi:MAG: hypothetical protein C0459_15060, partial [Chitinophaga sp.]|nr:hypothetical protein [Chitinophaga sp.]